MEGPGAAARTETASPRPKKRTKLQQTEETDETCLVLALRRLDPILQFLTRATGKPAVPLRTVRATIPNMAQSEEECVLVHVVELCRRGVLHLQRNPSEVSSVDEPLSWDDPTSLGFPPPPTLDETKQATLVNLHGSTKTAAKRRVAALKRSLKADPWSLTPYDNATECAEDETAEIEIALRKERRSPTEEKRGSEDFLQEPVLEEEKCARQELDSIFHFKPTTQSSQSQEEANTRITCVLQRQASYAGSNPGRMSEYGRLSGTARDLIPPVLLGAFGLEQPSGNPSARERPPQMRELYRHQAAAINSAMDGVHTLVCTGTGSGKSLCFLLPVLAAAMGSRPHEGGRGCTSLLMFPTKALAQDQMMKLKAIVQNDSELVRCIVPGVIDGDTPHQQRADVAKNCNVVLTNPDTLHAAILPGWRKQYRSMLQRVRYVVIDEAHIYEGVFGAHVALVLSRLVRLCAVSSLTAKDPSGSVLTRKLPTFLACSATMSHPEHHFRLLCPIATNDPVKVVSEEDDTSPRAPKHFFVWNPPIMNVDGTSTGRVTIPRSSARSEQSESVVLAQQNCTTKPTFVAGFGSEDTDTLGCGDGSTGRPPGFAAGSNQLYRRHAAEETALLLARAVSCGVRCIAFCKTRSLVEWVFERTVSALRSSSATEHLVSRVESYRGGYTVETRRSIEDRLFCNELLGVVGTSALELGVDIGGIDLSLHCGYPSSYSSLLQQAGRAGRGASRLDRSSLAIMICFNSPCEQHIWRNPKNFLTRGLSVPPSIPINSGLLQGHMLCAGHEFPLAGEHSACTLVDSASVGNGQGHLSDFDLLGSKSTYLEALETLVANGHLIEERCEVSSLTERDYLTVLKTHPSVQKPWTRVSLRSIEAINYSIVDMSHPLQGNKTDVVREGAVLDTIPYSRVFYHAFPGAVIMHRGKRYEVQCMTMPPAFASPLGGYRGSCNLGAFAKPFRGRYSTRPLSTMAITIVKQIERVDTRDGYLPSDAQNDELHSLRQEVNSLAGTGVVTVKREVHGYKKLSLVTRAEISRSEISLPPMEFDTYAFWVDAEASRLSSHLSAYDAGVHALSHALLAVAPLFVSCTSSDIDCDHSVIGCTRIVLFDVRAGGGGTCSQLWKFLFVPNGLLDAAIDLLQNCPSCDSDSTYDGGCPACLHSSKCLKFNQQLSRKAGLLIAQRMLDRLHQTDAYKRSMDHPAHTRRTTVTSPRRCARARALRNANDLKSARERQIVVGRPSWPLDVVTEGDAVRQASV